MDKLERQHKATMKIIEAGMKMLAKMQQENREFKKENREFGARTDRAINALIEAQMRTEAQMAQTGAKLERLIDSLSRRNGNGHRR